MEVSVQHHDPAKLHPHGKNPHAHWTGGRVGTRAGLDEEARGKILSPVRDQTPVIQSIVRHYID
jgi:hypothetical protein